MSEIGGKSGSAWHAWRRDLHVATIFLTRLPVRYEGDITAAELSRALRANAIIGAGIGAAGAAAFAFAAALGAPPSMAAIATLAATILLTGALHEDGLADVADGFGGGREADDKLTIMRDSRVGTYGALALILSVGWRAAAVATLADPLAAGAALVASHAGARGLIPFVMTRFPPVARPGLGTLAGTPTGETVRWAAGGGAIAAVLFLGPWSGLLAMALAAAVAWGVAALARRQIGGYTGDVLGSIEQAGEMAILGVAVAAA